MFEIKPDITREFLLSKAPEERYFEYYLGVPIQKKMFKSPLRGDKHPTCHFFRSPSGDLMYKDFAGPTFDFIGCVQELYKCDYHSALKIIANDFGYTSDGEKQNRCKLEYTGTILKESKQAEIDIVEKEFSQSELKFWDKFGISLATLKKYNVHSVKDVYINKEYCCSSTDRKPAFGYDFGNAWKIYFPGQKNKFLGNAKADYLQGINNLGDTSGLIITKSLKDVMLLSEYGINAVAPNSECITVDKDMYESFKLRFKNVIVMYDNDLAGIKGMHKYKDYNARIVFIKRKFAKDISDFRKDCKEFNMAIKDLKKIIRGKDESDYFYVFQL